MRGPGSLPVTERDGGSGLPGLGSAAAAVVLPAGRCPPPLCRSAPAAAMREAAAAMRGGLCRRRARWQPGWGGRGGDGCLGSGRSCLEKGVSGMAGYLPSCPGAGRCEVRWVEVGGCWRALPARCAPCGAVCLAFGTPRGAQGGFLGSTLCVRGRAQADKQPWELCSLFFFHSLDL